MVTQIKTKMEVPDKIFLAFDHGFVAQASTSKEDADGNNVFLSKYDPIEYLNKDTLLKWAKEKCAKIKEMSMEISTNAPELWKRNHIFKQILWGQGIAFKQVIDKIESL